jgi:hypothetical protein
MVLPTGQISMSQVNTELSLATTTTISLNQTNVRTLAGVASGAISMNNLRGKSAGVDKSATTWSRIILTTATSATYPAGIRAGDAVFILHHQIFNAPAPDATLFSTIPGTAVVKRQFMAFSPQINRFVHSQQSINFLPGTNTLSGTSIAAANNRIVVFRRSPDYFQDPTIAFLGTEVSTAAYPSQAVAYTGSPSVILGLASTSRSNLSSNTMTTTIGGVTPTLASFAASTVDVVRLFYRLNITPASLTTAATVNFTGTTMSGYRPFVIH